MLGDIFSRLFGMLEGLFVSIPTDNALGKLYVFLDTAVRLLLSLIGYTSDGGGSILPM